MGGMVKVHTFYSMMWRVTLLGSQENANTIPYLFPFYPVHLELNSHGRAITQVTSIPSTTTTTENTLPRKKEGDTS